MICLSSPLLVGVYLDGKLIEQIRSDEKASEALGEILGLLSNKFEIGKIIYANGPGSFMGLKVAYLTLCTFCMAREVEFYGIDGFALNGSRPIRANKNMSFILKNGVISLQRVEPYEFELPLSLDGLELMADALPNYVIDAV